MSLYELHADLLGGKPNIRATGARVTKNEQKLFFLALLLMLFLIVATIIYQGVHQVVVKRKLHQQIQVDIKNYSENYQQYLKINQVLQADNIDVIGSFDSPEALYKNSKSINSTDEAYGFIERLENETNSIIESNKDAQQRIENYAQEQKQLATIQAQEKQREQEVAQEQAQEKAKWEKQQQENAAAQQSTAQTNNQQTNGQSSRHPLLNALFK